MIPTRVGDASNFPTADHSASNAGLAPVTSQPGAISAEVSSRRGHHRIKNALFRAAIALLHSSSPSNTNYSRKRSEGKRHSAAVICLAGQRCQVIFTVMRAATTNLGEPQSGVNAH